MSDTNSPLAKEPTPGDIAFMVLVFKYLKEKPQVDWDGLSTAGGFKSSQIAQVRFGQIKRKFTLGEAAAPKTPTKKKAGDGPGSASKITKSAGRVGTKGRKGKAAVKTEEEDDEEPVVKPEVDDHEAAIKPESNN